MGIRLFGILAGKQLDPHGTEQRAADKAGQF